MHRTALVFVAEGDDYSTKGAARVKVALEVRSGRYFVVRVFVMGIRGYSKVWNYLTRKDYEKAGLGRE